MGLWVYGFIGLFGVEISETDKIEITDNSTFSVLARISFQTINETYTNILN